MVQKKTFAFVIGPVADLILSGIKSHIETKPICLEKEVYFIFLQFIDSTTVGTYPILGLEVLNLNVNE